MLRTLVRSFSVHTELRSLNKSMQFSEVVSLYNRSSFTSTEDSFLSKQQYIYALKSLKHLKLPEEPQNLILKPKMFIEERSKIPSFFKYFLYRLGLFAILSVTLQYIIQRIQDLKNSKHPVLSVVNSNNHIHFVVSSSVRFSDIQGIDECKGELEEIVSFLKNPQKYSSLGAKIPKGVLLTGQPGTGKTLLAKAIAGEAGVRFYYCAGSDFDELFVGLGAKRLRKLFSEAKKEGPCIIFIDEIDSIGGKRNSGDMGIGRQTLNQLLVEMDGFTMNDSVIVIAATNFPESLDKAIKRSGRFDKVIDLPVPDLKGRKELLKLYISKVKHDGLIDIETFAKKTMGMTGADIANLVNVAALRAVKAGRTFCCNQDLDYAIDRIKIGIEVRSYTMSKEELMNTAYHEIGHALVAHLTKGSGDLHKITVLPRGPSLGHTAILDTKENKDFTRRQVLASVDMLMGGRAAEEIFVGKENITAGCSSDLMQATRIMYQAAASGIFEELVGMSVPSDFESMGDKKRNLYDRAVKQMLDDAYSRAIEVIQKNKNLVEKLAGELVEKETLNRQQFIEIVKNYR